MTPASHPVTLSLVIPVYNEARHLRAWCELLLGTDLGVPTEYIFVDDCSTDGSREVLLEHRDRPNVIVLSQPVNQGKGAALAKGIATSRGEIVVIQDADFEYSPKDIPGLIRPILAGQADVVFGSRFLHRRRARWTLHSVANQLLTLASNVLSGLRLTDMETCYKAFRGEIIRHIRLDSPRFGFEPEITAKLAALRIQLVEVPISYSPRTALEGKKITWKDGFAALWHIAYFNLGSSRKERSVANVPAKFRK